jgi:hypothetical protein
MFIIIIIIIMLLDSQCSLQFDSYCNLRLAEVDSIGSIGRHFQILAAPCSSDDVATGLLCSPRGLLCKMAANTEVSPPSGQFLEPKCVLTRISCRDTDGDGCEKNEYNNHDEI